MVSQISNSSYFWLIALSGAYIEGMLLAAFLPKGLQIDGLIIIWLMASAYGVAFIMLGPEGADGV